MRNISNKNKSFAIILSLFIALISINHEANATNKKFMLSPGSDKFFHHKVVNQNLKPGTILETRKVPRSLYFPNVDLSQIAFVSTNTFGQKIRATATLILPPNANQQTKIIEYNEWIDSLGIHCTPGYMFSNGGDPFSYEHIFSSSGPTSFIQQIMLKNKNYGLLVPDGNGLQMAFGANILSAHIALDAVRALKKLPGEIDYSKKKIPVFGYSGGAMITSWQAILEKEYAPDLKYNIVDYLSGGTPVDLVDLARTYSAFSNMPKRDFGIAITLLGGIDREYPNFNLTNYLNPYGKQVFELAKDQCLLRTQAMGLFQSGANLFKYVGEEHFQNMIAIAKENSLTYAKQIPSKHIMLYFAEQDTEIPQVDLEKALAKKWLSKGANVSTQGFPGDHIPIGLIKADWVLEYIDKVFDRVG